LTGWLVGWLVGWLIGWCRDLVGAHGLRASGRSVALLPVLQVRVGGGPEGLEALEEKILRPGSGTSAVIDPPSERRRPVRHLQNREDERQTRLQVSEKRFLSFFLFLFSRARDEGK